MLCRKVNVISDLRLMIMRIAVVAGKNFCSYGTLVHLLQILKTRHRAFRAYLCRFCAGYAKKKSPKFGNLRKSSENEGLRTRDLDDRLEEVLFSVVMGKRKSVMPFEHPFHIPESHAVDVTVFLAAEKPAVSVRDGRRIA